MTNYTTFVILYHVNKNTKTSMRVRRRTTSDRPPIPLASIKNVHRGFGLRVSDVFSIASRLQRLKRLRQRNHVFPASFGKRRQFAWKCRVGWEHIIAFRSGRAIPYQASGIFTLRTASGKGIIYDTDCFSACYPSGVAPACRVYAVWFLEKLQYKECKYSGRGHAPVLAAFTGDHDSRSGAAAPLPFDGTPAKLPQSRISGCARRWRIAEHAAWKVTAHFCLSLIITLDRLSPLP